MVVRKNNFRALCVNNKWQDFGNHTGFQYVGRTYDHLVIGEWYDFEKTSFGNFDIIINGRSQSGSGYHFSVDRKYIPEYCDFYKFFSTVQEQREIKLSSMGIS